MNRIAIPAATVLLVVVAIVGASLWNRTSAPRQVIELTERELSLPFGYEDGLRTGAPLRLHLQFEYRGDPLESRNWLSEDRLRAIGFTIAVPATSPDAEHTYRRVPPRVGWVAFEYDGPAFQAIEQRRALERKEAMWRGPLEPTRLVPVDAGPDFATLRARYPSTHVVLRAVIGLHYLAPGDRGPLIYGTVQQIVPSTVSIPHQLREALSGLPARPAVAENGSNSHVPPRYAAEVASGPLGVLYLRAVRQISEP
jgi:hypothetical protein